jgi:hypothetical protein
VRIRILTQPGRMRPMISSTRQRGCTHRPITSASGTAKITQKTVVRNASHIDRRSVE